MSGASSGWASIGERNTGRTRRVGPRGHGILEPREQRRIGRRVRPCHTSSIVVRRDPARPPPAASATFASRAEAPDPQATR